MNVVRSSSHVSTLTRSLDFNLRIDLFGLIKHIPLIRPADRLFSSDRFFFNKKSIVKFQDRSPLVTVAQPETGVGGYEENAN